LTVLHTWARYYAARGWPVFPLIPRSKKPIHKGGFKNATTDLAQVDAWWAETPDANIGIATGDVSGLFVVDLDDKEGRSGSENWSQLADRNGGDGAPIEHRTGSGGLHLVYKHTADLRNSVSKLAPGVDVRGEGGYIAAAPSIHPCGGLYSWAEGALNTTLAPPPDWLVEKLRARAMPDAAPAAIEGAHVVTREDLEAFIAYKGKYPDAAELVLVARAVLDGTSWGKGARHDRMTRFLGALRTFIFDKYAAAVDPEGTSELFDACTAAATDEGVNSPTDRHYIANLIRFFAPTDSEYLGKLQAAREAKKVERAAGMPTKDLELPELPEDTAKRVQAQNDAEEAIQRAFGSDRTTPYSAEELAAMEPTKKRWVLVTPAGHFLRAPGGDYIPVIEKAVLVKARDVLAPAYPAGVYLTELTDKGTTRLKSIAEVLNEYGQAPTNTAYSYIAERSVLDGDTFIQRVGRPVRFAPEYDAQIARWLELFAGEQHEALLDWLATILRVERPTAGLCIMGTSGAGKDLFIEGVAELWGGAHLSFERALSQFNHTLTESPLVVANEEVRTPPHFSGGAADALKEMISDVKRKVEAKYAHPVDLHGSLRVILATNSDGVLKFDRNPTPSDIVALDERILLLRPAEDCKTFLETELGGRTTTEAWVAGGGIARHVMWLQANRVVKPGPRFLVQGRGGLSDLLSADGRGSAAVLRALLEALLGPKDKDPKVVQLRDGDVWASLGKLKGSWATYGGKDLLPEDLGSVFESVCQKGSSHNFTIGGEQVRMRKLKWPVLLRAATKEGRMEELLGLRG
jgi:hypothetical protein